MGLVDVRPLARQVLDGLSFSEWEDGFNRENIPSNLLDGSYHLEIGTINGSTANQRTHTFTYPLLLRVFKKGFRYPAEAIDDQVQNADNILSAFLDTAVRLGGDNIKDIQPSSISVLPLDASNDNAVILEMELNFIIIQCY